MLSLSLVKKNNLDKIKQILTKFNLNTPATHTSTMLTFIYVHLKFKIILWEIVCPVLILTLDLKLEEDNKLFKDYKLNCIYNY